MAKKSAADRGAADTNKAERGQKSQTIRTMLGQYPDLRNKELAAMISQQGIKCTAQDIANYKAKAKKAGMLPGPKGALTVEDLLRVKEIVNKEGGRDAVLQQIEHLEQLASKVGGIERLRRSLHHLATLQE